MKKISNPNYYSIIPASVRYDKRLSSTAKLIYAEITALSNKEGFCWANNRYFANLYGISTTQVSLILKQLRKRRLIRVFLFKKEGNARKIYLTSPVNPLKVNIKTY